MEFWYKGRKHLLRGTGSQVKVHEAGKLAKHTSNTSQLCMIQVVPMGSTGEQCHIINAKEEPKTDARLVQLLSEYSKLIEEPTKLPPSRGVFNHNIALQVGTEHVNKRSYRYPSVKKDIIEGLVQQMLDQDSPSTFLGLMNFIFQKFLRKHVLAFFNDILIYNCTVEDRLAHLESVFVKMKKHQLFAKKACFFGVHRIKFLGHFITSEAGYYRRFVKGFGVMYKPLTKLTKNDNLKWSSTADSTFAEIKEALTHALVLALPDANKTFIMETDLTKLMPFDYSIEYKKRVENKVVDALSRFTGAKLLALVISPHNTDLFQAIASSWNTYQELKQLIEELQMDPTTHKQFLGFKDI
ncbi:uncharacterized protein [Nicotiana tomentosiformis]|uniref:uncharacterized protein n=1 Tax=Nicotiana tomentosiformis TaxID=4098 RepID=UPI00388CBF9D